MSHNLINNDVSRCNNHRCNKRANCKRYLQLGIDKKSRPISQLRMVSVTRFVEEQCQNYLPVITKAIIILISLCQFTYAQRDFTTVFSIGIDPKMAIQGPHPDREGNQPSLDYEVSFGFEWSKTRLLMQLKSHQDINFFKWTYMQFDYKQPVFKNFYIYGGLEMSQIRRSHPDAHYSQPDNYRDVTINPILFGANLEAQYKLLDDRFGIAWQASLYQPEDELKPYKKYRFETTITLFFYL